MLYRLVLGFCCLLDALGMFGGFCYLVLVDVDCCGCY